MRQTEQIAYDLPEQQVPSAKKHKDHVILRCQGKDTVRLARRLRGEREDGTQEQWNLDAWTPIHHRRMRIARLRKTHLIKVPTMASYVFLRHGDVAMAKEVMGKFKCPMFRIMRRAEAYVSIWDRELDHLRRLNEEMDLGKAKLLMVGSQAIVTSGPMSDYLVDVIGRAGAYNVVTDLARKFKVKVPPELLKQA